MTFKIGDQVSLKADPARQGLIVAGPRITGTITRWQIHFLDGERNYHPEKAILKEGETIQDDDEFDQLKNFRFSKIDQLTLSLTHNKLSGRLANLIYSLDATNTTFYPHQFKPVLALIDTPAKGILIGDEVGLGKTIEAGLIWTELKTRYNSKRLIIICKAFLKTKWTNEFKEKFGINLQPVTPKELLEKIKNANDLDSFAYVASYDALRPPKNWRRDSEEGNDEDKNNPRKLLAEFLDNNQQKDLFDLVIFDECQYMRNEETMTYQLGRLFSKTSMQVVMLSATPINNSSDDLFNLFNILDESLFPYQSEFPRLISQNSPIIFTRDQLMSGKLKDREEIIDLLENATQASLYEANEQLKFLLNNLPNQEVLNTAKGRVDLAMQLDKINIFAKVFTRTRKRDMDGARPQREATPFSIQMTETEKALYEAVTNAVLEYATINDVKTGFLTNSPQQQMCSSFAAAVHWWRLKDAEYQSELLEQLDEVQSVESEQVDTKKIRPLFEYISQSVVKMGDLSDLERNDSKYNKLIHELKSYWNKNAGKKIILFSFFKATLRYLKRRLENDGILSELLYGGINKDIALENFEKSSEVNLLLASEVASEGVDLQFSSLVINYDLPWNPMRVEQRIGRIDRIGQQEKKILIWNFFYKDSIDDRIYMKLYTKLKIFEEALGGMEEIIGDRLKLNSKTKDYLEHNLTEEQVNTLLMQADQAVEYVEELEKQLDEKSSQLVAHDDFIKQSINEARQFGRYIKAEDLIAYFETFIKEYYQPSTMHLINKEINSFTIDLTIQAIVAIQDYWNKEKINFSSAFLDPQKIKKTKFVFSNKIAKNQASVEYINQFHPIIKFISDTLQKKYQSNPKKIVTASTVKAQEMDIPEDVYIYACQRFSFTSNVRVIERLEYRAKGLNSPEPLSADQSELLVNAITAEGKNWAGYGGIDTEVLFENYGELLTKLERDFENRLNQLKRETNDRVTLQQNSLMGYLINEKSRFDERIQNAIEQKKESYLKSLRTQWTNIENNIKVKHEKLESQKNLSGIPSFVSLGLVEFKK